jgi:hypothetical protein
VQAVAVRLGEEDPLPLRVVWAERLQGTRFEDQSGRGGWVRCGGGVYGRGGKEGAGGGER